MSFAIWTYNNVWTLQAAKAAGMQNICAGIHIVSSPSGNVNWVATPRLHFLTFNHLFHVTSRGFFNVLFSKTVSLLFLLSWTEYNDNPSAAGWRGRHSKISSPFFPPSLLSHMGCLSTCFRVEFCLFHQNLDLLTLKVSEWPLIFPNEHNHKALRLRICQEQSILLNKKQPMDHSGPCFCLAQRF